MHYYQFNIGDYRKDTSHLTLLEHGIYRQLIDSYYLNEKPLCADDADLMRTHRVITDCEKNAFKNVVKDFFKKTKKGYIHKKCDDQISKYSSKSEKARLSAKARWDAKAMRTHSEGNANHKPITNNHKPITNKKNISDSKLTPIVVIELYNSHFKDTNATMKLKPTHNLKQRISTMIAKEFKTLQDWKSFFEYIEMSDFLMGKTIPLNGHRQFKLKLEWIIKPENLSKILERQYHGQ